MRRHLSRPGVASLVAAVFLLSALHAAAADGSPTLTSVDLGTVPRGVAVNAATGVVYAVLYLNGTTVALDAQKLQVFGRVSTPSPYAIALNPLTGDVYVSQGEKASVSVLDSSANQVLSRVQGAGTPYSMAFDYVENLLFAADTASNSLWVISGSTYNITDRLPMGDTSALAVDPSAHLVFVGNLSSGFKSGSVTAYSTSALRAAWTLPLPAPPRNFAVDPTTHILFVTSDGANGSQSNFFAINETSAQVVYSARVGQSPDIVTSAASPDVWVSDAGQGRLYELDGTTGEVLLNSSGTQQDSAAFAGITSMAFDSGSGRLYITERDSTMLLVLGTTLPAPSPAFDLTYLVIGVVVAGAVAAIVAAGLVRRRRPPAPPVAPASSPA
jgi:DNA-binding beta-propeller fold protein YncE